MTLDKAKKGQMMMIKSIPDSLIRAQAIRFGINEGTIVTCSEIVPAGPVIIERLKQEIAIGRGLAKSIIVEPVLKTATV